jgi:hypothetical protein
MPPPAGRIRQPPRHTLARTLPVSRGSYSAAWGRSFTVLAIRRAARGETRRDHCHTTMIAAETPRSSPREPGPCARRENGQSDAGLKDTLSEQRRSPLPSPRWLVLLRSFARVDRGEWLRSIRPIRAADGYSTRKAPPETTRQGSSSFESDDRTVSELFLAGIRDWEAALRMGLMTTS